MSKSKYLYIIVLSFMLSACNSDKKEETAVTANVEVPHDANSVEFSEAQYKSVGMELGNITNTNLSNYIKASGAIEVPPQNLTSITSSFGGHVKSMNVIEGKHIGKGTVVATIENPEFLQIQQDYMESNSQMSYLRQDLTRQKELVKENIAARKSLQRAQSEYNSMSARVAGLRARLQVANINPASVARGNISSRANIYAPQSGYVTKVYTNIGKYVGTNEVVADIANTGNMMVKVQVFEKDVAKIKVGQIIRFQATGDAEEKTAKVYLIGKDIHGDRTVDVLARIQNVSQNLLPGMFVNAIIELGSVETPALPDAAIVGSGGKNFIFILEKTLEKTKDKDGKEKEKQYIFRKVEVQTGVSENGFTAVTLPAKFNESDKVVLKGAYDLLSKMNNMEEEE